MTSPTKEGEPPKVHHHLEGFVFVYPIIIFCKFTVTYRKLFGKCFFYE